MLNKISKFEDEYRFLSNFWTTKNTVVKLDDEEYPSVEHAYQAAKSFDKQYRKKIKLALSPNTAKSLGKKVDIRKDWNKIKVNIMRSLLKQKFDNPVLKQKLLSTGDAVLEEGNWWGDTFWGICPENSGNGKNYLGFLLMEIRKELKDRENLSC